MCSPFPQRLLFSEKTKKEMYHYIVHKVLCRGVMEHIGGVQPRLGGFEKVVPQLHSER